MSNATPQLRSLYRSFLRELPPRPSTSPRSPLYNRIRASFAEPLSSADSENSEHVTRRRIQEAQQYLQFAQAQRQYKALLERYNPGMNMDEEQRVRLTARRVGMDMPVEVDVDVRGMMGRSGNGDGGGENEGEKK